MGNPIEHITDGAMVDFPPLLDVGYERFNRIKLQLLEYGLWIQQVPMYCPERRYSLYWAAMHTNVAARSIVLHTSLQACCWKALEIINRYYPQE